MATTTARAGVRWGSVVVTASVAISLVPAELPVVGASAQSATSAVDTHDNSPSTPWTAFVDDVNVVFGTLVRQQIDLSLPSIGIDTIVGRTYNSAAIGTTAGFGDGWAWSFGLRVQLGGSSATVTREDGRVDTYTDVGGGLEPPPGVHDRLGVAGDGTVTLTRTDQNRYIFNSSGSLDRIIDPNENTITLSYSGAVPTSITDSAGRVWSIGSDLAGHVVQIVDPAGRVVEYEYVGDRLVSVTDAMGGSVRYEYDSVGRMTREIDQNGHATSYQYDGEGRVVNVIDPGGVATGFEYAALSTVVQAPLGRTKTFTYDVDSRVTGMTDALGHSEAYVWDAANHKVSVTDRGGHETEFEYDVNGNVTLVVDATGGEVTTNYDAGNRPTSQQDQLGRITRHRYDEHGNLVETTEPGDRVTSHTYDALGQPVSTTDPNGHTRTYAYSTVGDLVERVDPEGGRTTFEHDDAGRVVTETDPEGNSSHFTYDALGRILSATDGAGGRTTSVYDRVGNRLRVVDPRGNATRFDYDERDLLVEVIDPIGSRTITVYDSAGRRVQVIDPLGNVTTSAYDANDRLISQVDGEGNETQAEFDADGNQTKLIDALGRATTYEHDPLHRLVRVTDAMGGRADYGYNAVSDLVSITDPNGHTSAFGYDERSLPTSDTDPLGNTATQIFDAAGNLLAKTDANGVTVTYAYDGANRLIEADYPEGIVSFEYDRAGRKVRMVDPTGVTTYEYDGAGRLIEKAAAEGTIAYRYDSAGNLTHLVYPDGRAVQYTYDPRSLLVGVTDWTGATSGYGYDQAGRRVAASNPNGTLARYTYDRSGRVTDIQWTGPGGASIAAQKYFYDSVGNVTRTIDGRGSSFFTYDRLDRLTQALYADAPTVSYTYDGAGNRISMTEGSTSTFFTYDSANRLLTVGGEQVTWDENGNMLGNGETGYEYDSQNRLVGVTTSTQVIEMAYDGANRRVTRSVDGATTSYAVDEHADLARVVQERDDTGASMYGIDGTPIWVSTPDGSSTYYHQDRLGTTVAMTSADGTLAGTRTYDVFGKPVDDTQLPGSFWFAGEQYDEESGLIYLRARHYDPELGRFTSADPAAPDLTQPQTLNRYTYALNNPLRYTDPTGEFPWLIPLVVVVGAQLLGEFAIDAATTLQTGAPMERAYLDPEGLYEGLLAEGLQKVASPLGWMYSAFTLGYEYGAMLDRKQEWVRQHHRGVCGVTMSCASAQPTGCGVTMSCASGGNTCRGIHCGTNASSGEDGPGSVLGESSSGSGTPWTNNPPPGGAQVPVGQRPNRPSVVGPSNWKVTIGDPPTLEWRKNGSPDGRPVVASKVLIFVGEGDAPSHESPWVSGTTYHPDSLPYGTWSWRVVVRDDRGLISEPSERLWFTVVDPEVTITEMSFNPASPSASEDIVISACTSGGGGATMRVSVNTANDGSANGEWVILAELGVPCFTAADRPHWFTLPFTDGTHRVRVEAHGSTEDWTGATVREELYTLQHRRPAQPAPTSPADNSYVSSRTVTFSWQPTTNAASYRVRVWRTSDLAAPPIVDEVVPSSQTTLSHTFDADEPTLHWRVTATNDLDSNSSNVFHAGIDRTPPSARVEGLVDNTPESAFVVRWNTEDERSGVKCTNVQFKDGEGAWADWFACTTRTFALFPGQPGHTYYFRARATDNAGNVSDFESDTGDAVTTVTPVDPTYWWNHDFTRRRPVTLLNNSSSDVPTGYPLRLRLDAGTTPTALEVWEASQSTTKGDDVRVVYADRTELDRVVLSFTTSRIDILFRAAAPLGGNASDTSSYQLYYGNSDATGPPADRNRVLYPELDHDVLRMYDMTEGAGSTLDDRSGHSDATMNSALGWTQDGKFGPAVVIPAGTGAPAINAGADWLPTGAFTLEFWMKRAEPGNFHIAGQSMDGSPDARWRISMDDGGVLEIELRHPSGLSSTAFSRRSIDDPAFFDAFHHIAITYDGVREVRFYIDGRLDAARALREPGFASASSPMKIGTNGAEETRIGAIISNFALSAGRRTRFTHGQWADVTVEPSVAAGTEQQLTEPLPQPPALEPDPPVIVRSLVDTGTGADGPLVVTGRTEIDSHPTPVTGVAGSTSVNLADASGYGAGAEVLLHQTVGNGHYELHRISSVSGNTLDLDGPLRDSYSGGAQIVIVRNYTDVVIQDGGVLTAPPWDGARGGLLVFRASGTVRVEDRGEINVSLLGFRGGAARPAPCSFGQTGQQGEGSNGTGAFSEQRNANAGGGGRRTDIDGGGGGGGNGGNGESAQWGGGAGGAIASASEQDVLTFGGGGGGTACTGTGAPGARGGGIVLVATHELVVEPLGLVAAVGGAGGTASESGGGSGGGAGGTIDLRADDMTLAGDRVRAAGGPGGSGQRNYGGTGGDGRVRLEFVVQSGVTSPSPHEHPLDAEQGNDDPAADPPPTALSTEAYGTGRDGDRTITSSTDLNPLRASARGRAGSRTLNVFNQSGGNFRPGQSVLVHQTRGGTSTGVWELSRVSEVAPGQLTLTRPLLHTYNTDAGASRAQVVWVPEYRNLTVAAGARVSPVAWNGNTGGILAVLVSGLADIDGDLVVEGNGFRGGAFAAVHSQAFSGEGTAGSSTPIAGANGNGGGGAENASGGDANSSGGGGGHEFDGGIGRLGHGTAGSGGRPAGTSTLSRIVFGGGGGGGVCGWVAADCVTGDGAAGGGIIFLAANDLIVGGSLNSDGLDGQTGGYAGHAGPGAGGGGAGGAILIRAQRATLHANRVTARGGAGGHAVDGGIAHGFGSVGRIRLETCAVPRGAPLPRASMATNVWCATPGASDPNARMDPTAQFGDGSDGALVVTGPTIVNTVRSTASGDQGSTTLSVASSAGFTVGDEILAWQTQGPGAGRHEFAVVAAIDEGTLTLTSPLAHGYTTGAQAVHVPHYTDVTIEPGGTLTAPPWDGSTGGVLVYRANGTTTVRSGGSVDVSGLGFRGSPSRHDDGPALQGEGATGAGSKRTRPNSNGGGGGGYIHESIGAGGGGGGGAPGAEGHNQGVWGAGGEPTIPPDWSDLILGGGGGGAHTTDGSPTGSSVGGNGGGIALLLTRSITVEGSVRAEGTQAVGQQGESTTVRTTTAGSGGGGGILIRTFDAQLGDGLVTSRGGATLVPSGPEPFAGGAGGDGVIRVEACQTIAGSTVPAASTRIVHCTAAGEPVDVLVQPGVNSLQVSWTPPVSDGGAAMTDFIVEVSSNDGGSWNRVDDGVSPSTSTQISGLSNGVGYVVRVAAVNGAGVGPFSAPTQPVAPRAGPGEPGAPSGVPGDGMVALSWPSANSDGGSAVTDYVLQVSTDAGGSWVTLDDGVSAATAATVTGLTNGTGHMFRVAAVNSAGAGSFGPPSTPVVPRTVPVAPAPPSGSAGNGAVEVSWAPPSDDGGATVIDYTIEVSSDGGATWDPVDDGVSPATDTTVTGLTNGTGYRFRIAATNEAGSGPFSVASTTITPRTVPTAAGTPTGQPGDRVAQLSWSPPSSNGGAAVTDYAVQLSTDDGLTWQPFNDGVSAATTATVTGLTNGTGYRFRVAALNTAGTGPFSDASTTITPRTVPTAPAAPTAVPGDRTVTLDWNEPAANGAAITDYIVELSTDNGTTWLTHDDGTSTTTSTVITQLANGTSYRFRIIATNAAGNSTPSQPTTAIVPRTSASQPLDVTAEPGANLLEVSWSPPPSDGGAAITDFVIDVSSNGGGSWTRVDDGVSTATSAQISGLPNGVAHVVRVAAVNAAGLGEFSAPSDPVAPRTGPDAPGTPAGASGDGTVALSWAAPASDGGAAVTDYTVQVSSDGGVTWQGFDDGVSAATTSSVTGLTNGTGYRFRVAAINTAGTGPFSTASTTITPRTVPTPAGAPTGQPADRSVQLTWMPPASTGGATVTDYTVQVSSDGGATWQTFDDAVSPATTATVTGLTNGTAYRFRVGAVNIVGTGPFSDPSTTVTPRTVPDAPGVPTVVAGDQTATLNWNQPANNGAAITDYIVELSTDNGTTWLTHDDGNSAATSTVVTALANGTAYRFRITATNAAGHSTPSQPTTPVIPLRPPSDAELTELRTTLNVSDSTPTGGQQITVELGGLNPFEWVGIYAHSTPKLLGTAQADANGALRTTVALPLGIEPGMHTLSVFAPGSGTGAKATLNVVSVDDGSTGPNGFNAVSPARVVDTRPTDPQGVVSVTKQKYGGLDVLKVKFTGNAGVPLTGVGAVSLNVTAVDPDAAGFVTVFPCGDRPLVASVNYVRGQIVPNAVIAPLSTSGEACFYSLADTHLVIDINGWFATGADFNAVSPARVVDTRPTDPQGVVSVTKQKYGGLDVLKVKFTGNAGVPLTGVGAVSLNVTAVDPDAAGFVTVFPCGDRPLVASVNYVRGQIVPNAVIAPLSTSGEACFYSLADTHLVIDINGWFAT